MLPSSAPLDPCHCLASPPPIATTCDLCVCIYIKCEVYSCVPPGNLSWLVEVPADTHKVTLRPSSRTQLSSLFGSPRHGCECECPARSAAAVVVDGNNFVDDLCSVASSHCCSASRIDCYPFQPPGRGSSAPSLSPIYLYHSPSQRRGRVVVMTAAVSGGCLSPPRNVA